MWISSIFSLISRSTSVHCMQSIQVRSDNICCLPIWLMVTRQKVTKSDRKGAAAPAKQQRQRRSAPCTVSPHTEACFVVGCSPSFSSLVSSVGVGTGAKNAQIVWFQIRGQHCNFSVTVIVTLTPHADFPTNILLSWRFCQLSSHKIYGNQCQILFSDHWSQNESAGDQIGTLSCYHIL